MVPGLPKPPKIKLPSSPLDPLRDVIRGGRERVEKAGSDIRSLADELRSGLPSVTPTIQSESPLPAAVPQVSEENPSEEQDIATACVACAIGHFAGAAKLLNEAIRFRDDGIESSQVLDDIAGAIGELNAMERVDLTPERLQKTPGWERAIAGEALRESRKLRHRLEGIISMEEIEKAAADTESYYKKLHRQWYRGRFSNLGAKKAETIAQRVGEEP
jgi:hypothetical protein